MITEGQYSWLRPLGRVRRDRPYEIDADYTACLAQGLFTAGLDVYGDYDEITPLGRSALAAYEEADMIENDGYGWEKTNANPS